jgi:cytochrome c peroxidase
MLMASAAVAAAGGLAVAHAGAAGSTTGAPAVGAAAPRATAVAAAEPDRPSGPASLLSQIGRLMFFDPSLSASGKLACGTCHDPRYAYGPPPGKALAIGGRDMTRPATRAVPSLRYLHAVPKFAERYHFVDGDVGPIGGLTWDGRAPSLHEQAMLPLLAPNEMANGGPAEVARKLANSAYAAQFRAAFGERIFKDPQRAFQAGLLALESFQQEPAEFYPYSSRYDAFLRGEIDLTDQEERGAALFKDPAKGNCASCHLGVSRAGAPPPFTDFDYANVGVPRNARIAANADPHYFDLGLCGPVRQDFLDRREYCGFFRSPTVRNTAIRDAFFHNGVFTSLRDVMHFYVERDLQPQKYYPLNADGSLHKFDDLPPDYPVNVDHDAPLDRNPGEVPALTESEIDDVIAFLRTLTDGDAGAATAPTTVTATVATTVTATVTASAGAAARTP